FLLTFFFVSHVYHRDLHSFPTRRSSDLRTLHSLTEDRMSSKPQDDEDLMIGLVAYLFVHDKYKQTTIAKFLGISTARVSRLLTRSEEHTSELQSRGHLVCRLLLEKKNNL